MVTPKIRGVVILADASRFCCGGLMDLEASVDESFQLVSDQKELDEVLEEGIPRVLVYDPAMVVPADAYMGAAVEVYRFGSVSSGNPSVIRYCCKDIQAVI
jgi:hypothetical protein